MSLTFPLLFCLCDRNRRQPRRRGEFGERRCFWALGDRPAERHTGAGGERASRATGHHSQRRRQTKLCPVLPGGYLPARRLQAHRQGTARRNSKVPSFYFQYL